MSPQPGAGPDPAQLDALQRAAARSAPLLAQALGTSPITPQQRHLETLNRYGATLGELNAFEARFGARFIPSASVGRQLASLNDHAGLLKIPAYDGPGDDPERPRSIVAEQFAVIKVQVPTVDGQGPPVDRHFIKGYGDRLIDFRAFEQAMAAHSPHTPGPKPASQTLGQVQQAMETPLRSEIKRLSLASVLAARRDGKASSEPVTPLPPNPTPMAWRESWVNADDSLCPGAGPMLRNGTRKFQLDYNVTENRLVIFRNDKGHEPRPVSILSDSLGDSPSGSRTKLGPAKCEGPILAEIRGIRGWEDMGPATDHRGVKQGGVQRMWQSAAQALRGGAEGSSSGADNQGALPRAVHHARPGAHIRITTEDGAVHDLRLDETGLRLSLANPKPTAAHADSLGAFGGPDTVQADVDLYSYHGRDTGLHGSKTGFPDPRLVTSTGDELLAGPLLKDHGSTAAQALLRLVTFQPLIPGDDRSALLVRMSNTALTAVSKFACVLLAGLANEAMKGGDDSYIQGVEPLNASGAGRISIGAMAGAAAAIVVAQEAITIAAEQIHQVLPEAWKRKPESTAGHLFQHAAVPMAEEMLRLMVNMGVQAGFGIQRGGAGDWGTLAATSALKGINELARERAGADRANHPHAQTALDVAQGLQYNGMRALGVALSAERDAATSPGLPAVFAEALLNRVVTRGYDQIVVPALKQQLNERGVVGPNASAFDSQLSHQYSAQHLERSIGQVMKALATDPSSAQLFAHLHAWTENRIAEHQRTPEATEFFSPAVLRDEQIKQRLNRLDLVLKQPSLLIPQSLKAAAQQLGALPAAVQQELAGDDRVQGNVELAARFAELKGDGTRQLRHLDSLLSAFDDVVENARRNLASEDASDRAIVPLPDLPVVTNALSEVHPRQRRFVQARMDALEQHVAMGRDESVDHRGFVPWRSMTERPVPAASNLDYGLVRRPFDAQGHQRIKREQTTFSTLPQAQTWDKNQRMARQPGMDSIAHNALNPFEAMRRTLPPEVLQRVEMAVRHYTVESQLFHYPLRWQVTGEVQRVPIAPGIDVPYNIMNRPGNTSGSKHQRVDPIEALYINLGARISDKFPVQMFRAVVTEALYSPSDGEDPRAESLGTMAPGHLGVLTEVLSATMAPEMAAGFNVPISNYLSAPREQSQRISLYQETGVNIAKWADLVQGEVIMVPGAVLQVALVDQRAGRSEDTAASAERSEGQDIGQVVYMKALDTYALERVHDRYLAYRNGETGVRSPEDGAVMIDPKSGHFYQYDAAKDDIGLVSATKNYFTGRPLEAGDQPADEARWRRPYTADGATRTTKDAIHAAILRNDPIVPFLDLATENVHHAWFRDKARQRLEFNESRDQVEQTERNRTRARAREISADMAAIDLHTPLTERGTASTGMLAWLGASLLRQPIRLLAVDDSGGAPVLGDDHASTTISQTYDKVDLQHPRQSIAGRQPPPALLVGVGEKGYYAITHAGGEFKPAARFGQDKSAGNFLHALVHAGYAEPSQYRQADGMLQPDERARASVSGLLDKVKQFTGTEYLVLQQALVDRSASLQRPDPPV